MIEITCPQCGIKIKKLVGDVNRAKRKGSPIHCSRKCFGLSIRVHRTDEEKRKIKKEYDILYREKNKEEIKAGKAEYHKRTYDPEKARAVREAKKEYITAYKKEYYSKPENKKHKADYDRKRRCKIKYGEFWEAAYALLYLDDELEQYDKLELAMKRGHYNKPEKRKKYGTYR